MNSARKTITITLSIVEVQNANPEAGIPGCTVLRSEDCSEFTLFDDGELRDNEWNKVGYIKPYCPISWMDVFDGVKCNMDGFGCLGDAIKFAREHTKYKYVAWNGRIYGTEPNKEITPWTVENL